MDIIISEPFKKKVPEISLGTILCDVQNNDFDQKLWDIIHHEIGIIREKVSIEQIKLHPRIAATREAYKSLGKDPNRYRPSAEALRRRIIRGFDLYQINTLVDLINLVSLKYGFSIGAFDADHVKWPVSLGIGENKEPYQGIGKGALNIECLPILRDQIGGIGTPTSDEMRTRIQLETKRLYVNINSYTGKDDLSNVMNETIELLKQFNAAQNIRHFVVS